MFLSSERVKVSVSSVSQVSGEGLTLPAAAAAGNVNPSPETWETEDTETLTLSEERNMKNLYASTEEYSESGSENLSADVNDFIPPEIVIFSVKGKRWSCDDLVKFTLHTDDDEDRLSWMITDS